MKWEREGGIAFSSSQVHLILPRLAGGNGHRYTPIFRESLFARRALPFFLTPADGDKDAGLIQVYKVPFLRVRDSASAPSVSEGFRWMGAGDWGSSAVPTGNQPNIRVRVVVKKEGGLRGG